MATNVSSIADQGNLLYEQEIRSLVEPEQIGKVIAIDVLSGDFAVGDNVVKASSLLRARQPLAEVWLMRVGRGYLRRMGGNRRL